MTNYNIGLSAIRANSIAINVTANNIANASTEGYHRQVVRFRDRYPVRHDKHLLGTGVDVANIHRLRDNFIESSITKNISEQSAIGDQLGILRRIETLLTPGQGSVHDRLNNFFNELERLAASPSELTQRQIVLRSASSLVTEVRRISTELTTIQEHGRNSISAAVENVNRLAVDLSSLSRQILREEASGTPANDLRDEYDRLVNELAQYADPDVEEQGSGQLVVLLGNGSLLIGQKPIELSVLQGGDGEVSVVKSGNDDAVTFQSGKLAGLLSTQRQVVDNFVDQLDTFAADLMVALDTAHATGIGIDGAFSKLVGRRSVSDVNAPLAETDTAFPITAGSLFVTVTDNAGARTTHELAIDPSTQSLADIATAISSLPNLSARVNGNEGTLSIQSVPGFTFDFAGRLDSTQDYSNVTGTTTPSVTGLYEGDENDQYTFTALSGGDVGVTAGLQVEVRDATGEVVTTLDVGAGYEVNSEIDLGNGIKVSFGPGSLALSDTFDVRLTSDPDTSGVLAAFGLNTLFTGRNASDIAINATIADDHRLLATSRTGEFGDGRNLERIVGLRSQSLTNGEAATFEEYLSDIAALAGDEVRDASLYQDNLNFLQQQLESERQSLSGVDPNEETVLLLQYQRAFEAAAHIVSTVNQTLDDLFRLVG